MNWKNPFKKKEEVQEQRGLFGGSLNYNTSTSYSNNKAMMHSAVYRCVDLISNSVAQMPVHIHTVDSNGYKVEVKNHPAFTLLNGLPNKKMNKYTFFKLLVSNVLLKGNAYVHIVRGVNGQVSELQYIPPEFVTIVQGKNYLDAVSYQIVSVGKVNPKDMLHFINFPDTTGTRGISVLEYARKNLQIAFDAEDTASSYFRSGANKAGAIKLDRPITDQQEEQILSRWSQTFNGNNGLPNGVVVLKPGMEYQPIQMNAADAQLLESRKFNVIDICRWFGVSPIKVFDMTNSAYSTVEAQNLDYLVTTLAPLLEKFENEINTKLFNEFENIEARFDTSVILRTDKAALVQYFSQLYNMGVLSPNEIRMQLDLPPIEGGDKHFSAVNLSEITNTQNNNGNTENQ